MGTQPEGKLSRAIISHIKGRGGYAWKVHGGPTQPAGTPDVCATYLGYSVYFESKMIPGDEPTPIQKHRQKQIRDAGGWVKTVYSVAEARKVLDAIDAYDAKRIDPEKRY